MERNENIDFCLKYLIRQQNINVHIPVLLAEKQVLLRSLMNVWRPQPLSEGFLAAQDRELRWQLEDKGIVEIENDEIVLWQGDITRLHIDAIVNAANGGMLGCFVPMHRCIDNAIHSAAGLQLRQECDRIMRNAVRNNILEPGEMFPTGKVMITPGYNLPAKYVIHTVGPIIRDGKPTAEQEAQLAECYNSSIDAAILNGCRSIAFCCISTGEFRFPHRRAAEIAVDVVRRRLADNNHAPLQTVVFNVFKDVDNEIYNDLLRKG